MHDDRPLHDRLADAGAVLLLAPDGAEGVEPACADLLAPAGTPCAALSVTLTQPPASRLAALERHAEACPAELSFVSLHGHEADVTRTAERAVAAAPAPTAVAVDRLQSPADLVKLGVSVSRRLEAWRGSGRRIGLCLHSLTTLVNFVELERLFRFLHTLGGRLEAADAVAHYHLDPEAVEPATVEVVERLVDAVVELEPAGEPRVRPAIGR